MRKTRNALVAAVSLVSVFGTASIAQAVVSTDNTSSVEAAVSPNAQSATQAGNATLFTQVQTFDADEGPLKIVPSAAERVYLDFDDDVVIDPTGFAECALTDGQLAALTTTALIEGASGCDDAIVGSGAANALVPTPPGAPVPVAQITLTVTTMNGPQTTVGGPCTAPAENTGGPPGCEFVGGKPQIILHAYTPAQALATPVRGEVQTSPAGLGADYGQRLAVTDAPDTGGDFGSLILFNSTVGALDAEDTSSTVNDSSRKRKRKNGKTIITITKTSTITNDTVYTGFVQATCGDDTAANGGKEYDFRGEWVYDDQTTDTDTYQEKCGNPAP